DQQFTRSHLSLAAAHLQQGHLEEATAHLGLYVESHPDHVLMRARYAELLLRQRRVREARAEYERFTADAQARDASLGHPLLQGPGRLLEMAMAEDDGYGEHLHRGIGLYLLARERAKLPDPEAELPAEGLLCKAAAELTLARLERPEEARPCWYLYEV